MRNLSDATLRLTGLDQIFRAAQAAAIDEIVQSEPEPGPRNQVHLNLSVATPGRGEVSSLGPRGIWGNPSGGDAAGKRQFLGRIRGVGAWSEVVGLLPSL